MCGKTLWALIRRVSLWHLAVICPLIKKRIIKDVINMQEIKLFELRQRINKRKNGKYRTILEKIGPVNPQVVGSSPTGGAKKPPFSSRKRWFF